MGKSSVEECPWRRRKGIIRDVPKYGVEECLSCRMVTHETDLREFIDYKAGSMHTWADSYGGTLKTPEEDISRRVQAVRSLTEDRPVVRILDFGSGNGEMIEALSFFFEVEGLEPEEQARLNCLNSGLKVSSSIEELTSEPRKFDAILLFHVVEHFYNARIELSRIFDLLSPKGFLVIETPNSDDALLTEYESQAYANFTYWSHHPMLHSSKSITSLVSQVGFEDVQVQGVQRYGLANHLYWMARQESGGHIHWKGKYSEPTEFAYAQDLIVAGKSDTLWIVATKPEVSMEVGESKE